MSSLQYKKKLGEIIIGERKYRTFSEEDQIKALLSIFNFAGVRPEGSNTLFCSKSTTLSSIENFILRSKRRDLVPFVLSNFDELPLSMQL